MKKLPLLAMLLALATDAFASILYVDGVNGNDKNDCKTRHTARPSDIRESVASKRHERAHALCEYVAEIITSRVGANQRVFCLCDPRDLSTFWNQREGNPCPTNSPSWLRHTVVAVLLFRNERNVIKKMGSR